MKVAMSISRSVVVYLLESSRRPSKCIRTSHYHIIGMKILPSFALDVQVRACMYLDLTDVGSLSRHYPAAFCMLSQRLELGISYQFSGTDNGVSPLIYSLNSRIILINRQHPDDVRGAPSCPIFSDTLYRPTFHLLSALQYYHPMFHSLRFNDTMFLNFGTMQKRR